MSDIHHMRHEYHQEALHQTDLLPDPIKQFEQWFQEAIAHGQSEANAMTLATYDPEQQRPDARIVLLKYFNADGFVFFTNYLSQKGQSLAACPQAALLFWWPKVARQVRINGTVTPTSAQDSLRYFHERPKGAQLAAVISPQSQVVPSRETLTNAYQALSERYPDQTEIPCPEYWGGYCLAPTSMEFWQGRENRLHDRFLYRYQSADQAWERVRLAP